MLKTSLLWEQAVLGEPLAVRPDPIVLGCMIMDRYTNLQAALAHAPGAPYPAALTDHFIPGDAEVVRVALRALGAAQSGGPADAYAIADHYMRTLVELRDDPAPSPACSDLSQRDRVRDRFERCLSLWGAPDYPVTIYRVGHIPS